MHNQATSPVSSGALTDLSERVNASRPADKGIVHLDDDACQEEIACSKEYSATTALDEERKNKVLL